MHAAQGILTTRGGMTSHAAVVARGMGRPCVAGAGGISVDYGAQTLSAGGRVVRAGDIITLDGATGEVFAGPGADDRAVAVGRFRHPDGLGRRGPPPEGAHQRRNPARCPDRAQIRRRGHRPVPHRAHVLRPGAHRRRAADDHGRRRARPPRGAGQAAAVPARRISSSCSASWQALPVTIRLLDPPLHEFLPHADAELAEVAEALGTDVEAMRRRAAELAEANPMLGHRGCRLGITYPEIYEMQARAIFEGAIEVAREAGTAPVPEIMIPLVGTRRELEITRAQVDRVARAVFAETGTTHRIHRRHHDRAAARRPDRRPHRRGRRFLQLRHQRPDPDHLRPVARRRRQVPARLCRTGHPAEGPVRLARHRGRRRAGAHRRRARPRRPGPTSSSASAASMAAIRPRSPSARRSASTTSRAALTACRWPGWRPPRRRWHGGGDRTA